MNDELTGKICLVTGTSRGIGKVIAETFCEAGAIVYAEARTEGCLDDWSHEISEKFSGQILPIYFDITDSEAIRKAVIKIKKEQERLDVLVNNAGMVTNENLGMIRKQTMLEMFEVNVFGLLDLTQLIATRFMVRQKSGSIINIASIVAVEGSKGQIGYSASKGAVISMTKSMAKELAPSNIRVNAVAPGMIGTERLKVTIKEEYKNRIPEIGMGRLGKPEDIANACLYFATDRSAYTTGQVLVVGGGYDTAMRDLYDITF